MLHSKKQARINAKEDSVEERHVSKTVGRK